jgi:hypothetical protein
MTFKPVVRTRHTGNQLGSFNFLVGGPTLSESDFASLGCSLDIWIFKCFSECHSVQPGLETCVPPTSPLYQLGWPRVCAAVTSIPQSLLLSLLFPMVQTHCQLKVWSTAPFPGNPS